MKPRSSELQLSEHSIILTQSLCMCIGLKATSIIWILDYPNVFAWSQLVRIIEVALYHEWARQKELKELLHILRKSWDCLLIHAMCISLGTIWVCMGNPCIDTIHILHITYISLVIFKNVSNMIVGSYWSLAIASACILLVLAVCIASFAYYYSLPNLIKLCWHVYTGVVMLKFFGWLVISTVF